MYDCLWTVLIIQQHFSHHVMCKRNWIAEEIDFVALCNKHQINDKRRVSRTCVRNPFLLFSAFFPWNFDYIPNLIAYSFMTLYIAIFFLWPFSPFTSTRVRSRRSFIKVYRHVHDFPRDIHLTRLRNAILYSDFLICNNANDYNS